MFSIKRICQAIILGLVLASSAFPAATVSAGTNSWTLLGIASEKVNSIALNPNQKDAVWVGTDHGVWEYIYGTWTQWTPNCTYTVVFSPPPRYLYAGTASGVMKQTGSGWVNISTGLTHLDVFSLAVDPATPTTLYAGTYEGGIFKTTNGGANWSASNTGLTELIVTAIAIDPADPSILYAGTTNGLFKSFDGGGSWSELTVEKDGNVIHPVVLSLAVDPTESARVYTGTYGGVYKTENEGRSWYPAGHADLYERITSLAIDPVTPTTIYAGAQQAVYKTWNGGDTWTILDDYLLRVNALGIKYGNPADVYAGTDWGVFDIEQSPDPFGKSAPADGAKLSSIPTLSWGISSGADEYEYCLDTTNNGSCDTGWVSTGSDRSVTPSGWSNNTPFYWQVRSNNVNGTEYATGGNWWSYTVRHQTFADVPVDHPLWQFIEAFYNAGITTSCGTSPLIFCPGSNVTRAAMAVFLLRAKYGASYTPPAATHTFADLPVAGKEWQEAWVDQFYLDGITTSCGTSPLRYCPENPVTRAAMAVFILRAKYGSSYTPPPASHYFADMPVAGKEWMEPWVDELYRQGVTTGCGTGPLIYCPESSVKRQAMAAFIVRAFNLPLP